MLASKRDCDDEFGVEMEGKEFTLHEKSMGAEIFNFIESQREIGATSEILKVCIFAVPHYYYKAIMNNFLFITGEICR